MPAPADLERADPARFVEACGRRVALLGHESGVFELWIWPLKIAHAIALEARPAGRPDAAPAQARGVRASSEQLELSWVHPEFTLRQRIVASLEERALVMLVSRESGGAVDLTLRLAPDFVPQWPAGLGGRIATRDEATRGLLLTEELGRFACIAGGSEVAPVDAHGDHDAAIERVELRAHLAAGRESERPVAFVFAGAEVDPGPLAESARRGGGAAALGFARAERVLSTARALFRRVAADPGALLRGQVAHWRAFRERTTTLRASDAAFERAFQDGAEAIERAWVEVDGVGRGLVAGLGPSRGGERPGFGWFFDGDALIAARAMAGYGDLAGARAVLRFAASHQRDDGKLMHELVLSARLCDWVADYPYAYYKADNAPRFASVLAAVVDAGGDLGLARELLPTCERALDWMEGCVDARGLLSNVTAGLAAVEAGPLLGRIDSEAFLAGLWLDALASTARLARLCGREDLAARCAPLFERARAGFETLWSEQCGHYAFAHLTDGGRDDSLSVYTAHALARGHGEARRAYETARRLNQPRLVADWGARMFAEDAPAYDAAHYNTGSVFPYLTQFGALALYRHGLPDAGFQVLASLAALSGFSGTGLVPEHLRGDRAVAPTRGVPHQIFSSAALVQVVLSGLFGLRVDAPARRLEVRAALPPGWSSAGLEDLRVGAARVDLTITRHRTLRQTTLRFSLAREGGEALSVLLRPTVAPLSELLSARVGGEELGARVEELRSGMRTIALDELTLDDRLEVELALRGGPRLVLPAPELVEGDASHGLRATDHWVEGQRVTFELWGFPGHRYRVPCRCDFRWEVVEGGERVGDALVLDFPPARDGAARKRRLVIEVEPA